MFYNKQNRDIGQVNYGVVNVAAKASNDDAHSIGETEQVTVFKSISGTTAADVFLPPLKKVIGKAYTVVVVARADTAALTLKANAEDGTPLGWTNKTLDAAGDRITLVSNGYNWVIIENAIA